MKRKLEAMDTNDGASSKQAAEDCRPLVWTLFEHSKATPRVRERASKKNAFSSPSSSSRAFFSIRTLLLLPLFSSPLLPLLASSALVGVASVLIDAHASSEMGREARRVLLFGPAFLPFALLLSLFKKKEKTLGASLDVDEAALKKKTPPRHPLFWRVSCLIAPPPPPLSPLSSTTLSRASTGEPIFGSPGKYATKSNEKKNSQGRQTLRDDRQPQQKRPDDQRPADQRRALRAAQGHAPAVGDGQER